MGSWLGVSETCFPHYFPEPRAPPDIPPLHREEQSTLVTFSLGSICWKQGADHGDLRQSLPKLSEKVIFVSCGLCGCFLRVGGGGGLQNYPVQWLHSCLPQSCSWEDLWKENQCRGVHDKQWLWSLTLASPAFPHWLAEAFSAFPWWESLHSHLFGRTRCGTLKGGRLGHIPGKEVRKGFLFPFPKRGPGMPAALGRLRWCWARSGSRSSWALQGWKSMSVILKSFVLQIPLRFKKRSRTPKAFSPCGACRLIFAN